MAQRVLVISNMYPSPAEPAYGVFVERCVLALRRRGVPTDTVVMAHEPVAWRKLLAYLRLALQANRQLAAGGHGHVVVHQPLHSLLACLPALVRSRAALVLNFHGHDLLPVTRRGRLLRALLRPLFARAALVLVPSERFRRLFEAEFGAPARVFASGGVGPRYLDAAAPPLRERESRALFLSRWVPGKGWALFLRVAARVLSHAPHFRFTIAGRGPDEARIRAAVAEAGLAHAVELVHTRSDRHNAELYRRHRYFLMPSAFDEGLGLVNLEAMASGCVVLSADFAAAREYVEDGVSGFLLERARFEAEGARIVEALEADLDAAQRIADAARQRAACFAEAEVMADLARLLVAPEPAR